MLNINEKRRIEYLVYELSAEGFDIQILYFFSLRGYVYSSIHANCISPSKPGISDEHKYERYPYKENLKCLTFIWLVLVKLSRSIEYHIPIPLYVIHESMRYSRLETLITAMLIFFVKLWQRSSGLSILFDTLRRKNKKYFC